MKKKPIIGLLILAALFITSCATTTGTGSSRTGDQTHYTQVNMWVYGDVIHTVNYSVERKIPVNTEITILSVSGSKIYFHENNSPAVKLAIVNRTEYTGLSTTDLLQRYFAPQPVNLDMFSPEDREFILNFNGYYYPGITKDAVLIGRGYPPLHRTATTESDMWIYWRNRWKSRSLEFVDGKTRYINGRIIQER